MEDRDKFDELLVSYLLNELDPEEEALVSEWLSSNLQNELYLEELKKALNLVRMGEAFDKVNVEAEWNRFEQARDGKEQKPVLLNEAERFGNEIIKEVGLKRKTIIYRTIAVAAVAACILLTIGLGWSLFSKEQPAEQALTRLVEEEVHVSPPLTRNLENNTGKTMRYQLEDGTMVTLYPNSELSFQEPFESDRRDLQLNGKAEFEVTKNHLKPFTVFSGEISTTALGTRFIVAAFKNSNHIYVRLLEGKVVVKSKGLNQIKNNDYYLFPGEEFIYNTAQETTSVRSFGTAPMESKADSPLTSIVVSADDRPSVPKYGRGSWYMFNNQPLSDVFDQLADMYNVEIHYSKKDIAKMYFIGTFAKTDSLESVLKQITQLNKLKLTRENNKYSIKK